MTKDTFIKIVIAVIKDKGVSIPGSKETKLSALGRRFESSSVSITEAMDEIRLIFSDDYELDRHAYSEIEKALKRY